MKTLRRYRVTTASMLDSLMLESFCRAITVLTLLALLVGATSFLVGLVVNVGWSHCSQLLVRVPRLARPAPQPLLQPMWEGGSVG